MGIEDKKINLVGPDGSEAEITPTEMIIGSDKQRYVGLDVLATDEKAVDAAIEYINDEIGPIIPEDKLPKGAGSSFSFNSNNWNSNWEPKGPKKKPYKHNPPGPPSDSRSN